MTLDAPRPASRSAARFFLPRIPLMVFDTVSPAAPGTDQPRCGAARQEFLLAITAILLVFCVAHFRALSNAYVINDDVRQQLFWMQQWRDPALYPDDLLTDFARHYVSYGVRAFYRLATLVVAPLVASKALTGVLFLSVGLTIFGIGRSLGGRSLAWTALGVFLLMPEFLHAMSGGLARSFAPPLMALFWLAWLRGRGDLMGLTLMLQALFIPYVFPLCALACGLAWLASRLGRGDAPPFPQRFGHWLVLGFGAGLAGLFTLELSQAGYGPLVDVAEMVGRPEFTDQGRLLVFPPPSLLHELVVAPFETILPFKDAGPAVGVLAAIILAWLLFRGARRLDFAALRLRLAPAVWLAVASLLLYGLARQFLLKLFVPSRYVEYTCQLLYCLGLAVCLRPLFAHWSRRKAALVMAGVVALAGARLWGQGLYDYGRDVELYDAVRAHTPKDALLAGHPYLMDNVLTFGQRDAFATFELAHPWCRGLWSRYGPRLDALFSAYYAKSPEEVRRFCHDNKIDFLVVDARHYSAPFLEKQAPPRVPLSEAQLLPPWLAERIRHTALDFSAPVAPPWLRNYPAKTPFFAPYDTQIRALAATPGAFALLDETDFPGRKVNEHQRLVDMRPVGGETSPSGVLPNQTRRLMK